MHGAAPTAVTAEREHDLAAEACGRLRAVMRELNRHAPIQQQALGRGFRVQRAEQSADELRIMDEAVHRAALSRREGHHRQAVAERDEGFLQPGFILGCVNGQHPQRVRVLLPRTLEKAHDRLHLTARVRLARAHAEAHALLVHEVDEVEARRYIEPIAREVHVLGRGGEHAPGLRRDAYARPGGGPRSRAQHDGGPVIAAAVGRQDIIVGLDALNPPFTPIRHEDLRALGEALVFIPHDAQVVVRLGEVLDEVVLGAVGVLILVHEEVFEAVAVLGAQLFVAEDALGPEQQIIEVAGPVLLQAFLVEAVGVQGLAGPGVRGLFGRFRRQQAAVLPIGDDLQHLARVELLLRQAQLGQHLLHEALLIGGIEDDEVAADGAALAFAPEDAGAEAVEGAHPERFARHAHELLHALAHLLRRLVGEGDGEDRGRVDALFLDQPRDAPRDDRRLARPRARQDQQWPRRVRDGFALGCVQATQKGMVGDSLGH